MRNTIAFPTLVSSSPSRATPYSHKQGNKTESQQYKSFIRNEGNAIPKKACTEAKGSNPTAGRTLLCACNPFKGNSNHWQVAQEEAGRIICKTRHGSEKETFMNLKICLLTEYLLK